MQPPVGGVLDLALACAGAVLKTSDQMSLPSSPTLAAIPDSADARLLVDRTSHANDLSIVATWLGAWARAFPVSLFGAALVALVVVAAQRRSASPWPIG